MALVPRIVTRNWRLKLSAFGLAVLLWALVRTEPSAGGRQNDLFTVPVRVQVGDLGWTLAGEPDPPTVQVRLRGPTEELIRMAREGTSVRVAIDSVFGPDTLVELRRDWVVLGSGSELVVEDISPANVRLMLQPTLAALLPLEVVTTGELPTGLALAAPLGLNPRIVRVRGPARSVRGLYAVPLQVLDLGSVIASGIYPVDVDTTGLGDITVSPLSVTVGIRLEPFMQRTLVDVPVIPDVADGGTEVADLFLIVPATVEVRLEGARTPVTGTRPEEVQAVVQWEPLEELGLGEDRRLPIRLMGIPDLVSGFVAIDSVLVRRVAPGTRSDAGQVR